MEPLRALGWTLLHFVWQGALVGACFGVALAMLHRASAQARYLAGCAALCAMVAAPAVTFGVLVSATPDTAFGAPSTGEVVPPAAAVAASLEVQASDAVASPAAGRFSLAAVLRALDRGLPWIVALWILGASLSLLRLASGWLQVLHLRRRATQAVPETLQRTFQRLTRELGIRRVVRLARSVRVAVPTVTGWWRPVVIVPASALTGLSPQQLEAVLAHELAHIRRHDYLVNLFQAVAESLLFYHPVVWWISSQIRRERENCCDDVAVAACGDRATYARALTALETSRLSAASPALAATGGSLVARIRRLALEEAPARPAAAPAAVVLALLLAGAVAATQTRADSPAPPPATPDAGEPSGIMTVSKRDGTRVSRSNDGHETRYQLQQAGRTIDVRLVGEVTLDRDLTTIESLSPGAELQIYESRRGQRHELRVRPAGVNGLDLEYRLDGRVAPFDSAAARWLSELVPTLMRSGGLGAPAHARRLVREGVRATLDEIDGLESNSVRGVFYEELLVRGGLSESEIAELAERASRDISSNSTLASLYGTLASQDRLDGHRVLGLAAAAIDSNSTNAALILRLLAEDKITPVAALEAMKTTIDSQSTRASMVLKIAGSHGLDGRTRDALMDAMEAFDSNSTLSQLLGDLEQRRFLSLEESVAIAVKKIDSNSTLAAFLRDRMQVGRLGAEETLTLGARHIDSDSTFAELVYSVAVAHRGEAGIESLLRRSLREISSNSTRAELAARLDREGLLRKGGDSSWGARGNGPSESAPRRESTVWTASDRRRPSDSERASRLLRKAESNPHDPALIADLETQLDGMTSNSTMATLLLGLEQAGTLDAARVRVLAAERIASNSTRASLLKQLLDRGSATPAEVLRDADTLASESTRASLVLGIATAYGDDPRTYDEVLTSLRGFASNSTLATLLLRLDEARFLETEEAVALAAAELESNSTLASFLRSIRETHPSDRAVRAAVIDAYGSMASHSTLAIELERGLDDGYFDAIEALTVAANGLRDWDGISRSGVWQGGVQVESYPDPLETFVGRLAQRHGHEGSFRRAYFDAAETMRTPAVRQRLLEYLTH